LYAGVETANAAIYACHFEPKTEYEYEFDWGTRKGRRAETSLKRHRTLNTERRMRNANDTKV
jgi:hypothetical protein